MVAWYKNTIEGDHIGKTIVIYNSEERLIVNILYGEKIQMKILWNEERVNILKEFYSNDSWEDLYLRLGTNNRMAIQSKASKLRIKRNIKDENVSLPSRSGEFTEIEDDYIIKNYNNMKAKDIAVNLNRGLNQIYKRVQILNIKKRTMERTRYKNIKANISGFFK